jgi:two-component system, chemotaxis family, chemotaxis protein CheY
MANILVIDDSESALTFMEQILTDAGHRVTSSLSASEATRLAARIEVDLIVTDIYMPDMDGLEVIAAARKALRGIPVIAVSGAEVGKDMLQVARQLGAVFTMQKPFTKRQLLYAVGVALAPTAAAGLPSRVAPLG